MTTEHTQSHTRLKPSFFKTKNTYFIYAQRIKRGYGTSWRAKSK